MEDFELDTEDAVLDARVVVDDEGEVAYVMEGPDSLGEYPDSVDPSAASAKLAVALRQMATDVERRVIVSFGDADD